MTETLSFWMIFVIGILSGLLLASWGLYLNMIDWREVKAMMIRYIFSLRNHIRLKWLHFQRAYLKVLRRLI